MTLPNKRGLSSSTEFRHLRRALTRAMMGQERVVDRLLIGMLVNGAILLEGPAGIGKRHIARRVATVVGAPCVAIRLTPDLSTTDLREALRETSPRSGDTVLLASDIDFAPPRVQSLLFEIADAAQRGAGVAALGLPPGTQLVATRDATSDAPHPLSNASLDRFLMRVRVTWPFEDFERNILRVARRADGPGPDTATHEARASRAGILAEARAAISAVRVGSEAERSIVDLVGATRDPARRSRSLASVILTGAGLGGTIGLDRAARALAWLSGRASVTQSDIAAVVPDVLMHRLTLSESARSEGLSDEDIVALLLDTLGPARPGASSP